MSKLSEFIKKLKVEKERDALKRLAKDGTFTKGHFKLIARLKQQELIKQGLLEPLEEKEEKYDTEKNIDWGSSC